MTNFSREIEEIWVPFYEELEPEPRKEMLQRICEDNPEDEVAKARRKVLSLRHPKKTKGVQLEDVFLWQCVNFLYIYRMDGRILFNSKKRTRAGLSDMGIPALSSPEEERAFYLEACNAVRRYLSTCQSASYRKKYFGLVSIEDDKREEEILKDIWRMGEGLMKRLSLEEEMELWAEAVKDTYCAQSLKHTQKYEEYRSKQLA